MRNGSAIAAANLCKIAHLMCVIRVKRTRSTPSSAFVGQRVDVRNRGTSKRKAPVQQCHGISASGDRPEEAALVAISDRVAASLESRGDQLRYAVTPKDDGSEASCNDGEKKPGCYGVFHGASLSTERPQNGLARLLQNVSQRWSPRKPATTTITTTTPMM